MANVEPTCPTCSISFVDVGPASFPRLPCPGCGAALAWDLGTKPAKLIL